MELFGDILVAVSLCAAVLAVIWSVKGAFLTPVRRRGDTDIFTVVRVAGDAPGMEQAVRGLEWLIDSGREETCIIIADGGLTPEARRRARLLAEKNDLVLCRTEQIIQKTEEFRWTESERA